MDDDDVKMHLMLGKQKFFEQISLQVVVVGGQFDFIKVFFSGLKSSNWNWVTDMTMLQYIILAHILKGLRKSKRNLFFSFPKKCWVPKLSNDIWSVQGLKGNNGLFFSFSSSFRNYFLKLL